jgi:hypothetical protein
MADNTYTNISDLPTLDNVGENTWSPVEVTGKVGKKVDLNTFAVKSDITGKADKATGAVAGNVAKLDGNGNLVDSGISSENVANVKPDWNAEAGTAAEILNKPTIPATGYTRVNLGNIADGHVVIPVHNRDSITANLTCDILVSSITLDLSDDADDAIVLCHLTNGSLIHSDDLSIKRGNKSLIVVYPPIPNQSYCTHVDTLVTTVYDGSGSAEVPTDFSQMRTGIDWGSAPTDLASNLLHAYYVLENAHHILFRIVADYCFIHILPNN